MRILTSSLVLVLALALAPAAAMAQTVKGSAPGQTGSGTSNTQPVGGPGITSEPPTQVGSGANNSQPSGGPGIDGYQHKKTHKRAHHKFYGKHHDYTKSSPAKGPSAPHFKTTGTN